jgi:hypothetical protein
MTEKIDELIHEYCILGLMNSSDFIQKLDKIEIDYVSQNQGQSLPIDSDSVTLPKCGKCEMLGEIAPCDECYYKKYSN